MTFDITKVNDSLWIFNEALKDPESVVEYFEKNKHWQDWSMFGQQALGSSFTPKTFDKFPSEDDWNIFLKTSNNGKVENLIDQIFYKTTKLYVEENNISFENWSYKPWSIARYDQNADGNYAMMHHTDHQRDYAYSPGEKFGITVIFYLNDNYDGGEIAFKFLDEDDLSVVKEEYVHKPKAGDVLVFGSGHPNYHGVHSITKGNKYIIRVYWRYEYPGHHLWHSLKAKYGEDTWRDMENERTMIVGNSRGVSLLHNIPFWTDFEEYYKKEIEAL